MGVNLTPIIVKESIELNDLKGRSITLDGDYELRHFLTLIRKEDGTPLMDSKGNITSHLAGLLYRSTRFIWEYGIKPIFVFDGLPPILKEGEEATMTSRLTGPMIEDAKRLLGLLGIPYVQAPGEGEAQAAYMTKKGDVWATGSVDYAPLLFGTPRLVRYVTKESLSSKGGFCPLRPEVIDRDRFLSRHGIDLRQLIDIAILIGTDYNPGIKGVGPKTALRLIRQYGSLEELPMEIAEHLPEDYKGIRDVFLEPEVIDNYRLDYRGVDEAGLYQFLCLERGFSEERVRKVIEGMNEGKRGLL